MDKDTILDYVTETPGNTNRAVLGSMLDSIGGGGGVSNIEIVKVEKQADTYVSDKTYTQILDAFHQGKICIAVVYKNEYSSETYDVIPLRVFTGYNNAEGQRYYIYKSGNSWSIQCNEIKITDSGATYTSTML